MPLKPNICRVCLSRNHPMTILSKTRYKEFYEKHTGNELLIGNGRPDKVCYECNIQLKNFYKLLQLSKNTEKYIKKTYKCGVQLLQEKLDELAKDLESLPEPTTDCGSQASDEEMQDFSGTPTILLDDDTQEAVAQTKSMNDGKPDVVNTPSKNMDVQMQGVAVKIEAIEYDEIELVTETDPERDSDADIPSRTPSPSPAYKIPKSKLTYVMKDHNYSRHALEVSITDNNDILQDEDDSLLEDLKEPPLNGSRKSFELSNSEEKDKGDSIEDFEGQTLDSNNSFELSDKTLENGTGHPIELSTNENDKNEQVILDVEFEKSRRHVKRSNNEKNEENTFDVEFEGPLSNFITNTNQKGTFDLDFEKQALVESRRPLLSITEENENKEVDASVTEINKLPKVTVELERIPITKHYLRSAKKKVKKPKIQMFYCHECNYKCQFKSIMEKHTKIHRSHKPAKPRNRAMNYLKKPDRVAMQKRGECEKCGKTFKKQLYLNRHKKLHLKMYECDVCGRQFHHKSTFLVHTRTHTGEKPFGCKWCEKTFNDKSNCRKHMKTHTGTTKYPCMMCTRVFSQKSRLRLHAVDHIL